MLSYDSPVSVNGQPPPSPTNMSNISNPRSAVPTSPKAVRPAPAAMSSSTAPVQTNGTSQHHIWLVTGPAGCGKSTVAQHLATNLNYSYIEGDEYHPKANIEKMSAGIPLTDADRWDWLTALREESIRQIAAGSSGVVLTCSALKRKYRDVIRVAPYFNTAVQLHFIYLSAKEEVLLQRVAARENHYMGANMVQSQFDILEPPMEDEVDVVSIDVTQTREDVMREALARALQTMESSKP